MIHTSDILAVTKQVTRKWERQRKAEDRGRRSRSSRRYVYSDRVNFTQVAHKILPAAYAHASGNGKYTVATRQFYYASRDHFLTMTGREISAPYFSSTILVQYMNRHPEETANWKITADPRGKLTIANASHEVSVPCGTLAIDQHLVDSANPIDPLDVTTTLPLEWPSLAEGKRYQGVLYIEKEGFEPILKEAKIAERFDLAILSCKGQSVVAARRFLDHVCRHNGGVPLLIVHDFDKSGFEIGKCLTEVSDWAEAQDRVVYRFKNKINSHDLGLRLPDIEKYNLKSETWEFKGDRNWNWNNKYCTAEEEAFLRSDRRVELNAFTSPQLIEWLESKLSEHLPTRLIPDDDTLVDAYRRAMVVADINAAIESATAAAQERAREATVPKTLRRMLKKKMQRSSDSWDRALYSIAKSKLYPDDNE